MKKLLLSLLFLGVYSATQARCKMSGISPVLPNQFFECSSRGIYPPTTKLVIHKNSVILLEFFGSSQQLVAELGKKHMIYLKDGDKRVMLVGQEILKGDFQVTQVVFKPLAELEPGSVYELVISNLKEYDRPTIFNQLTSKFEPVRYTVTTNKNLSTLLFTQTPTELKKTMVSYGCGPAMYVYYQLRSDNDQAIYIRTFLKNKTTGNTTEYLLPVEDNTIKVGHGMCRGAFRFDNNVQYEISFMLVDHAGNNSSKTAPVPVTAPSAYSETE